MRTIILDVGIPLGHQCRKCRTAQTVPDGLGCLELFTGVRKLRVNGESCSCEDCVPRKEAFLKTLQLWIYSLPRLESCIIYGFQNEELVKEVYAQFESAKKRRTIAQQPMACAAMLGDRMCRLF